jgi:DNA repair protein RadC
MQDNLTIRDIPRVDRPREKLIKYGPGKLSNEELLAIVLRTGKKGMNVLEVSQNFFKTFSNEKILNLGFNELRYFNGFGEVKACELIASIELGKRLCQNKKNSIFLSPKDVWEELKDIRDNRKESFVIIFLDSRNQEIKREIISTGTLTSSIVHPREVFEPAIKYTCASIMLAHNHPSGISDPSEADIEVTERLVEAGKLLDIQILDHVIVSKTSWFSFKENDLL